MEMLNIDKQVIVDLVKLTDEINRKVESIELMNDSEFMESLKKSKEQIKEGEFASWDAL
jgi:hypothetical protein